MGTVCGVFSAGTAWRNTANVLIEGRAVCNLGQILFALISLRVNTAVAPTLQQLGKMSERVQATALCLYVQEVL